MAVNLIINNISLKFLVLELIILIATSIFSSISLTRLFYKNNSKKQSKKAMVTISEIEYKFLKAQNEQLLKQNRELQSQLNGRSRGIIGVLNSLGRLELDKYAGEKDVK